MQIKQFVFSPFAVNTYLLWDNETRETAIVDPACLHKEEEFQLLNFIKENKLTIKYLLNTHGHIDHIFGNKFVYENFSPQYFAPEKDLFLFTSAVQYANQFGIKINTVPLPENYLTEERRLFIGRTELKCLFTPGHTPGEYSFYFPSENICFTGDVLFKNGIGRTDFEGGNYSVLISSIKNKLFTLPEITKVYAGHGEFTTIGEEKTNNFSFG